MAEYKELQMRFYRPKFGVGTKTLVALSLVFWLPVSALAMLLFQLFQGMMQEELEERVAVHLKGAVTLFEQRAEILEGVLSEMARRPDLRRAIREEDTAALRDLLLTFGKQHRYFSLLAAVDTNQRVITRRNGSGGDVLSAGDALSEALVSGRPASATELVSDDLLRREDAELSNLVKEVGLVRYTFAPVRDGNRVIGVLAGGMLLSSDPRLGNRAYSRFGAEMALFAGNPRDAFFLHATNSLPRTLWSLGQLLPAPVQEEIRHGRSFRGVLNLARRSVAAGFEPLQDSRGRVVGALGVATPMQDADQAVLVNIAKAVGVTALLGLALALLSVFFVHHDITRPLAMLVEAMRRFGAGELATRVDLRTGDQLETLGAGFNEMAEGIRKREERFRKHNEVAKLFMSTMDMEQLLDETLQIVVTVTSSQLGILYLWEDEGQCLMPHAQYGTSAELAPLVLGEGYPGRAAKDRKRLTVTPMEGREAASIDMGFMQSVPAEVVYVPLVYQESVLGVLVLGSARHYGEDESLLFDYLADQISIALDNARMHQRIRELSITDGLTDLYNRRFLNTRLEEEWARSHRHEAPIAVLLSDIDDFKAVNDTYGHERGDEVLRQVAAIFRHNARKEDLVARYGGEEFVVVLPNTDLESARQMAERICSEARSRDYPWMEGRGATLSIGVAAWPESAFATADELLQAADQAMYKAKTTGKDRVERYR